jgi:segregation and condensation protein B
MHVTDPHQPPEIRKNASAPPPSERIRALQAMLFVSSTPVKISEIAEATGWDQRLVERDVERLQDLMEGHGLEVQRVAGALRLVTAPHVSGYVEKLIGVQTKRRLTRAQLETLAIVAYRQPATRAQVEAYRGVNCERLLAQLVELRLIREAGRAELPGRPYVYGTTSDFLRYFGLDNTEALPDISELKVQKVTAGVSASQAIWNAAATGCSDEEEVSSPNSDMKVFKTLTPLNDGFAADRTARNTASDAPSSGLKKLFDKIRGKAPTAKAQ